MRQAVLEGANHVKTGIMTFQTREAESVKALRRGMDVNKQEG